MAELSPAILWLLFGCILLAAEAFGASGIGCLFAGLGAVGAGIATYAGVATDLGLQGAYFFALTALAAVVLWRPLQRMHAGKRGGYDNMVGTAAIVTADGLDPLTGGSVRWSGTIMKARLHPDATAQPLPENTRVKVLGVTGNVLIVSPEIGD